MEYEVRTYCQGDEEQIVPLLQLVFNGWETLDFWRWKYLDNPFKKSIITVGVDNTRIIGVIGSIFQRIKIGNKVLLCGYGTDAGVHPDFRRIGVYKQIRKQRKKLEYRHGIKIHYAATINPILIKYLSKSYHVFPYHLQYFFRIRDMSLHKRMNPTKSLLARARRLGFSAFKLFNDLRNTLSDSISLNKDISISEIQSFDDRINTFWDEIKDHYNFIVERTKDYLNWKYCDQRGGDFIVKTAEEDGRILGYSVLKMESNNEEYPKGEIIDLLTIPERLDIVDALVADATNFFNHNKINLITSLVVNKHPYERIFERHGFLNIRKKMHLFYDPLHILKDELKIIESSTTSKVHLSSGDLI